MNEIRSSQNQIGKVCSSFFSCPGHLNGQFSWLTCVPNLKEKVDKNLKPQLGMLRLLKLQIFLFNNVRVSGESSTVREPVIGVQGPDWQHRRHGGDGLWWCLHIQGHPDLGRAWKLLGYKCKKYHLQRLAGTHLDSDGSQLFQFERELPHKSNSPFILAVELQSGYWIYLF